MTIQRVLDGLDTAIDAGQFLDDPAALGPVSLGEPKGVVYTKRWVVDLILDLAGYRSEVDLTTRYAVEPAAGEGAFLVPMIQRLMESVSIHGRPLSDAGQAITGYELNDKSATAAMELVKKELGSFNRRSRFT